jgi:hypothetical protein
MYKSLSGFAFRLLFSLLLVLQSSFLLFSQKLENKNFIPIPIALNELAKVNALKIFYNPTWFEGDSISSTVISLPLERAIDQILKSKPFEKHLFQNNFVIVPAESQVIQNYDDVNQKMLIGNPYDIGKYRRAQVKGKVIDGQNFEELVGVIVYVEDLSLGTTTDINGNYLIELPVGEHKLNFSYVGYQPDAFDIKLVAPGRLDIELMEESHQIEGVTIYARRGDSNVSLTQMSLVTLDAKTLQQLPSPLGERDVIKSLTLLPGVQSVGEFGTGFHVRGGSADQNLILVEGVPLFNSSHLFGLTSLINPDLVSNVTLIKGGIPAKYGERTSSVMDIKLGSKDIDKLSVNGGLGLLNSRLSIHSPTPLKNGYISVGGRSSYSNWLLNSIPDEDLMNSSANFYDLTAIAYLPFDQKNNITLFGYYSYDSFAFSENTDYDYSSRLGSLRWNRVFTNKTLSSLLIGHSDYAYNVIGSNPLNPNNTYSLSSSIQYNNLKWSLNYFLNSKYSFEGGVNGVRYSINPGEITPFGINSSVVERKLNTDKALEIAAYVLSNINFSNTFSAELGLRYSHFLKLGPGVVRLYDYNHPRSFMSITDSLIYDSNEVIFSNGGVEPRLSFRFMANPLTSLKLSYNRINQYINLVSNTSLPTPADVWSLSNTYQKPVKTDQIAIGAFRNSRDNGIEVSLELYYKNILNIPEPKNNANIILNPFLEADLTNSFGYSYGAEVYLKKNTGKLTGWVSYTFSKSERRTESDFLDEQINLNHYFPANFDKPHNLVVNSNLQLSRRWRAGGTFTYSSGRPITLPEAVYVHDGKLITFFSDRNKYRLPDYHRLDLSLSFDGSLRLTKKWKSYWTFSVVNIYGRKNIYSSFYQVSTPSQANNYQRYSLYKLYIIGRPLPSISYNFIF